MQVDEEAPLKRKRIWALSILSQPSSHQRIELKVLHKYNPFMWGLFHMDLEQIVIIALMWSINPIIIVV